MFFYLLQCSTIYQSLSKLSIYTQKTQNVQKANKTNLREIVDALRNEKSNDNL